MTDLVEEVKEEVLSLAGKVKAKVEALADGDVKDALAALTARVDALVSKLLSNVDVTKED